MKRKKKILGLVVALFAFALSAAFTACGGVNSSTSTSESVSEVSSASASESSSESASEITPEQLTQKVVLENFNDAFQSLILGTGYELPEKVSDTSGKEYEITYSVTTESGKELGLIENKVFVNYLETYYVVGSVEVATGDIRTQTTTITVTDEGKPWITFGEIAVGQQGVEYTLPEITVHDDSGETIMPTVKLYLLNGDEKAEEITAIEEGVFTPTVGGYYYLEVSAEDSTGNADSAYEVLYIRSNTAETTQLVTFRDQSEVDANFQFTADSDRKSFEKKYIPEFAGEKMSCRCVIRVVTGRRDLALFPRRAWRLTRIFSITTPM